MRQGARLSVVVLVPLIADKRFSNTLVDSASVYIVTVLTLRVNDPFSHILDLLSCVFAFSAHASTFLARVRFALGFPVSALAAIFAPSIRSCVSSIFALSAGMWISLAFRSITFW